MKAEMHYQLENDDQPFAKQLGECLNTISFVFTHHPELQLIRRQKTSTGKTRTRKEGEENPHSRLFNGGSFTADQVKAWSDWVDKVIAAGRESITKQHPAYRESHTMALDRFRETADDFLSLFYLTKSHHRSLDCETIPA